MKYVLIILCCFIFNLSLGQEWETIRRQYPMSLNNKKICEDMIKEMQKEPVNSLKLGYLGAFQAVWANHVQSPFSKLSTFKKGKNNLEKAILQDPKNIELRWIRLSLQLNIPSFLGYNAQIKEDKAYVKSNMHNIQSPMILKQIKASKALEK